LNEADLVSHDALVREYYGRIDASDLDWVVNLFDEDAVYERADATYTGRAAIARFFREERQIRGVHILSDLIPDNAEPTVVALGRFCGVGRSGDSRQVAFADVWRFRGAHRVIRRQTFLALGSQYVRA
jgi:hypothetical protein